MLLGRNLFADYANAIVFPLVLTALATIAALIGGWFVYFTKNKNLVFSFARGLFVEVVVFVLALWPLTRRLMGDLAVYSAADIYLSALIGLVVAILAVGIAAFWALSKKTKAITTVFSPAPFLTTGLALFVVLGIGVAYSLAGVYGITIAVVAAVSLVGVVMTVNAVATIANNVQALNALANPPVEDKENVEFSMAVNQATKTATRGYLAVALGLIIPILFILYRHQFIGLNLNLEFL
jgi:K(+)-stimulated pyrophosphate-energized sodium pump